MENNLDLQFFIDFKNQYNLHSKQKHYLVKDGSAEYFRKVNCRGCKKDVVQYNNLYIGKYSKYEYDVEEFNGMTRTTRSVNFSSGYSQITKDKDEVIRIMNEWYKSCITTMQLICCSNCDINDSDCDDEIDENINESKNENNITIQKTLFDY